ncbi:flippase-like domain-containing protein [Candidatus Binatia bacterium]|nr:flippase-like domain-containing protein [Candidatus Binatia bacterium]
MHSLSGPASAAGADAAAAGGGRRRLPGVVRFLIKAGLTAGAFYLLLTHTVRTESGETVTAVRAIIDYLPRIDPHVFWRFTLLAMLVKTAGILASMLRWHLLLIGQGIRFRFGHIVTTFLIGRFLGTFLPSTLGLDGYKLYDAARFSGRIVPATAATLIEKCLGIVGIFVSFLVTFPLGYTILGPRAGRVASITVPCALAVVALFFVIAFEPRLIRAVAGWIPGGRFARIADLAQRLAAAASAYAHHTAILAVALGLSFLVHFLTAAMYFCTALAVGAEHAHFWEVTFASTIQIFATVMSPFTIAGEGVREIVQALLLAHRIGVSQSIISAALGFWAAEALTLSGGVFYLLRRADYRPPVQLDGGNSLAAR